MTGACRVYQEHGYLARVPIVHGSTGAIHDYGIREGFFYSGEIVLIVVGDQKVLGQVIIDDIFKRVDLLFVYRHNLSIFIMSGFHARLAAILC